MITEWATLLQFDLKYQCMDKIRIAIADDHELFRQGLIAMLELCEEFEVVIEASDGAELLELLEENPVDVLILDLDMPVLDGFGVLEAVNNSENKLAILIVSMHYSQAFIAKALKSGAHGFLPKNSDFDMACQAIKAVKKGGFFFDKATSHALAGISSKEYPNGLTEREVEIIRLICEGKTTQQIADQLFVSARTVDGHRYTLYQKTNSENVPDVVIFAVRHGLYNL